MDGYRIEHLSREHDRAAFTCGVEPLDRYLRQQARQDDERDVARAWVLLPTAGALVVGYYTLSACIVEAKALPAEMARKLPRYPLLPAVLVGRLAVDLRFRGRGLGAALLADALRRCWETGSQAAALVVLVDAKDEGARAFYARHGFQRLLDDEWRLFLPMRTVEQQLGS